MSSTEPVSQRFEALGLPIFLLESLTRRGYDTATPIQAATIPQLLEGHDIVGLAQTGTGKTAAFALPALTRIEVAERKPQVLVLCPTRELALQVGDAFRQYGSNMKGLKVAALCGGADMRQQLRALKEGVHIVVATPGRMLDHLERGSADFSAVKTVVLDEADEMLRMGFIDDVDTILAKTPSQRQVALFSATMPPKVRAIANKHLHDAQEISVAAAATTNENIEQCYWLAKGASKVEALTRLLAFEDTDGVIVFTRTRESTAAVAELLRQRGFQAAPLNGDMDQKARVRTIDQLKSGAINIVVATDVAARGLDVDRISHVINFDVPFDEEAYVHRIGRTGRAGRKGKAILFVVPRERRMLRNIERLTRQEIPEIRLPSPLAIDEKRREEFANKVREAMAGETDQAITAVVDTLCAEAGGDARAVAIALAGLLQPASPGHAKSARTKESPDKKNRKVTPLFADQDSAKTSSEDSRPPNRRERRKALQPTSSQQQEADLGQARPLKNHPDVPMERFRVAVGRKHGVKPGELVGAIANEAGIEGDYIGTINILDECSTIDLPEGMPKQILRHLKKTRVKGVNLSMARVG